MKILLLKPIGDEYYVIQPNLGLGYIATIMLQQGHQVEILDSGKEQLTWDKFILRIVTVKYDVIGIQMFTHELLAVQKHTEIIRKHCPDSLIIVGGAHISGDPEGTMNLLKNIDFGFAGEAEIGIKKFLQIDRKDYANESLLQEVPNLIWRRNGAIVVNQKQKCKDISEIDFPAWHLMPPAQYPVAPHGNFSRHNVVAPLIVSRGCPFNCTFCAGRVITGRALRYRSLKNVIDEIKILYNDYGVREIHIEDDNFTMQSDYVVNFCHEIINLNYGLCFALPNGVRLDSLNEEMLKLMEQTGFYSMAVGIESGSDRVRKLMKKNLNSAMIEEKINLIKHCTKIQITGFFLLGYPGETESEVIESIEFAKSLKLDKASFMFVMPLPGSELHKHYYQRNRSVNYSENFFYYRIVEGMSDIPTERLKKLQQRAMWEFYRRPKIILRTINQIKTFNQLKILLWRVANIFCSS